MLINALFSLLRAFLLNAIKRNQVARCLLRNSVCPTPHSPPPNSRAQQTYLPHSLGKAMIATRAHTFSWRSNASAATKRRRQKTESPTQTYKPISYVFTLASRVREAETGNSAPFVQCNCMLCLQPLGASLRARARSGVQCFVGVSATIGDDLLSVVRCELVNQFLAKLGGWRADPRYVHFFQPRKQEASGKRTKMPMLALLVASCLALREGKPASAIQGQKPRNLWRRGGAGSLTPPARGPTAGAQTFWRHWLLYLLSSTLVLGSSWVSVLGSS